EFPEVEDPVNSVEPPVSQQLTSEAKELLIAACEGEASRAGMIVQTLSSGGLHIQAGVRNFVNRGDPRSEATWKGALDELRSLGLVEPLGNKESVFRITREGWTVYDQIKPHR